MPLQYEVFLVDDSVIADHYVDLGTRGFLKRVKIEEILDEESGQPGAHFVRVKVSPQASLVIRDREVKANQFGRRAKVQKTEFAIEPVELTDSDEDDLQEVSPDDDA